MSKKLVIKQISFPNTAIFPEQSKFTVDGSNKNCDWIKLIQKNEEMSMVGWFQIYKDEKIIAEIKESVCDIFYETI